MDEAEIKNLKEKVEDHEKRIKELEQVIKGKEVTIMPTEPTEKTTDISKLAAKVGVSAERFNEIFDIENKTLTVIKFVGTKDKEKTQNIALLTLSGYKYFFKQEEILSQEIRRNVAENGIVLNNFATYLNELSPSLVRRKGELKSPKTTYRLTVLGENKAKELLKTVMVG